MSQKGLELLRKRIEEIGSIFNESMDSPQFTKWHRDTQVTIEKIFGANSRNIKDFTAIRYFTGVIHLDGPDPREEKMAYQEGLQRAEATLLSMFDELSEFGSGNDSNASTDKDKKLNPVEEIERICARFHLVTRQMRKRHGSRETLDVGDEYDVQDLFHALLQVQFDDIRPEEYSPSYAGGASRIDFVLKDHDIVIEIKMTRKGLADRQIGEELSIDILRYQSHPNCKQLICFVYDPDGRINNPTGLQNDLNSNSVLATKVIVAPTGL